MRTIPHERQFQGAERESISRMTEDRLFTMALFYCRNVPESSEQERQAMEKKYGRRVRFFPIPCSGRLEPVHLLRALEEFADAAYVVTCPEGACRYFEGNRRAKRRVERTKAVIEGIGLERDRVGIFVQPTHSSKPLSDLVAELLEKTSRLGLSPVLETKNVIGKKDKET